MSGCPTTSAAAYENCGAPPLGLASYGVDTHESAIKAAVASSTPPGAPSGYAVVCEAMLRAGGLIYYKSNPGDCGSPSSVPGITSGQITGLSGSAASGVVGGLGVAGVIGGAATLGISAAVAVAVAGIESVFAHHDQAVANEQATICAVMNYFNPAKKSIDAAVRAGSISSDAGASYLTQVCNQAKNGLAGIAQKCNAACVYQAICQAFINYSHTWYDSLAPTNIPVANAPGGAPTYFGSNPGGVTATPANPPPPDPLRSVTDAGNAYNVLQPAGPGSAGYVAPPLTQNTNLPSGIPSVPTSSPSDYLNLGYNQPTGQSAGRADVPNTTQMPSWLIPVAIVAVVLLVLKEV